VLYNDFRVYFPHLNFNLFLKFFPGRSHDMPPRLLHFISDLLHIRQTASPADVSGGAARRTSND
jgi:hypothetical protein